MSMLCESYNQHGYQNNTTDAYFTYLELLNQHIEYREKSANLKAFHVRIIDYMKYIVWWWTFDIRIVGVQNEIMIMCIYLRYW